MQAIPQWSPSMSVRDPVLDAQHIELLELCRTVHDMFRHGEQKSELFVRRLEEISHVLEEHDRLEVIKLLARGERVSEELRISRAQARQQLADLTMAAPLREMPQATFQAMLCGWIQHHLH